MKKFWQEETRSSSYQKTTIQIDGVDHKIRDVNGQFYASPVERPVGRLICPKCLTDDQVVEFKLGELNIKDAGTQVKRLFTVVEKLDKMLVGNLFYDSYRKDNARRSLG